MPDDLKIITVTFDSSTHRLVPVEPTEAMVHYGGCAFDHPSVYMGGPSQHGQKAVRRIWRAMTHAAAPQSQEAE